MNSSAMRSSPTTHSWATTHRGPGVDGTGVLAQRVGGHGAGGTESECSLRTSDT
jgi:hypothetical protein